MSKIEMHVIPNPNRTYAQTENSVSPLTPINSDLVITSHFIGRVFIVDSSNNTHYLLHPDFPKDQIMEIAIIKGHDLLKTLAPLRCNHFGITTNFTGN